MATYGIYQVLDPLYVTPTGSVNSAKIVGGEAAGRIAVKVLAPPAPDPDEPNWEPKYFLDRAQVQRRVAAAGGAHWAPVYALGFTPEGGAYYVTDYHGLTARKMIDGRVPLDATALHAVVRSVLAGLEEIRRIGGRAHANLKPTNVLLVGKGPADELRAVLSDPGQDYKAQKDGEAGDLHAVGALIYELVLHRPPVAGEVPAASDPTWAERLGEKAEGWRQLCADLLSHPINPRVATLALAAKAADALGPSKLKVPHLRLGKSKPAAPGAAAAAPAVVPHANGDAVVTAAARPRQAKPKRPKAPRGPSNLKRRVVQLVAILILAGVTLGAMSAIEGRAREQVCAARTGWYGSLVAGLAEPQRREKFAADPHLRRVVDGVDEIERAGIDCRSGRTAPLGFFDVMKTRAAVAALQRVEQDLAPESWPQLNKLRELAAAFAKRGWQQPSSYVGQLLEGVRPTPVVSTSLSRPSTSPDSQPSPSLTGDGNLAQRAERLLRLRPIIEQQAAAAEPDWQQLDERANSMVQSSDPVVRAFGDLLRREVVAAIKLTDDGFEGINQLKQNAGLAGQLLDALAAAPPEQVDHGRFTDEVVRTQINRIEPTAADVRKWLAERPNYVIRRDEIAKTAEELQQAYQTTVNDVARSVPDETEAAAFRQEQVDVEAAVKDVRNLRLTARDIAQGRLTIRATEVRNQINGLKRYYHAEDPADWLKNLAPFVATSDRLRTYWKAWADTLQTLKDSMAKDRQVFAENKARTTKLYNALSELELNIPQPPEGLSEAFAAAAVERRDERLGALVDSISLSDPAVQPDTLKRTADELAKWYQQLKRLNADFPLRQQILTVNDRPDERWRKDEAFWRDPLVQRLVGGELARIERLQRLRTLPRAELVKTATAEGLRPEVTVAAWQQLGENRINPFWPRTIEELKTEEGLRRKVAAAYASLDAGAGPTGEQRKAGEELLVREGPRRWRRFVEAAESREMLGAALERQEPFKVTAATLGDLKPEPRFNVWLYLANQAINDNRISQNWLKAVIDNLRIAADELDAPKAAAVKERLAKLDVPEAFAGQQLENVFRLNVPGLAEPVEFRRVEPKDASMRPFYLGAREVTLGQFAGAIEGGSRWAEARKLSWAHVPGRGDGRRGPRVWDWVDAQSPRLGAPMYWMAPDGRNNFPPDFRGQAGRFNVNVLSPAAGGMPSDAHPMQYVSAQAALYYAASLGLRLPTSSEWRAAVAASGQAAAAAAAGGRWNLRDAQSWELYRAYAEKNDIAFENWPDRGAFTPGDPPAPSARPAAARKGLADGTLLFRPAASNDDAFHDLVGNVAEFVCEVPDAFARWPENDKKTADGIKEFLANTASSPDVVSVVAVIGGSALSGADVDVDKPLPVSRPDRGYSDIGFRLAFTAPSRNLAERLRWALAGEDYVWPRTASADTGVR